MKSHNISEIRTNGDLLDQLSCHEVESTFPNPALLNHCSDKVPWVILVNVSLEDRQHEERRYFRCQGALLERRD